MNFDKIKPYLPYAYVIMSAVGGVIVLILAILNEFAVSKAFLFIASVLIFLFSGLTYVYIFVLGERNRNYFLTDTLTGKNMRISDLTFSRVNERMNFFISKRVQAESELWLDGFLGKRGLFGRNDVFKFGYNFQAAMYSEGVMRGMGLSERPKFVFIAQEKT